MPANALDRYVAVESPVHRLDPRLKVVVTMLVILSNVLLPDGAWSAFLLSWGFVLLGGGLANLGAGYVVRRAFVALPFALAAVSAIFAVPGAPVFGLRLGPWEAVATDAGLVRFASIVVRSWISVQAAVLLTATTHFTDILHALRHLRVPSLLVTIVALMYRYLSVLTDEATRLLRAREARSARLPGRRGGGGSIARRARVAGNLAGQLFLRSYERSDRVYQAMLARGYRGQLLSLDRHRMRHTDWAVGGAATAFLLLLQAVSRLGLG